ncbi:MAG: GNAT family N-acetyltransferase [Proteobacteria bacterium]|nr:GNAT family N-acetyltransferase [Pseudomonadota bacterium]
MITRPITTSDFTDVLALNEESVRYLSPLSSAQLGKLHSQSVFHRVVEEDGLIIAFILALQPGTDYQSVNYQWFVERYNRFLYIDRVVVSQRVQTQGAGSALYREVLAYAKENHIPFVTCEFDIEPPNPISERFHKRFGFTEVGRQSVADGRKTVSLQISTVNDK